jgi:hypothetical protein
VWQDEGLATAGKQAKQGWITGILAVFRLNPHHAAGDAGRLPGEEGRVVVV